MTYESAEYIRVARSPVREYPRERATTESLVVHAPASHRNHEAFIVEASPSRHRDVEYEQITERSIERPRIQTISRPRSVSVHGRRRASSPVRLIEPRDYIRERTEPRHYDHSMVLVRPRNADHEGDLADYIRDLEEETRLLRLERQGGIEITRQRDTDYIDNRGNEEEVTEIRRSDRRGTIAEIGSLRSSG